MPKGAKTFFGFFVARTAFSPQSGPTWLADFVKPADWAVFWTKGRLSYKKSTTIFEVLAL